MPITALDTLIKFALPELRNHQSIPPLPRDAVAHFLSDRDIPIGDFFDLFSRRVAHEYEARKLTYESADAAMNSLHMYALNYYDVRLPSYSWEVFLAFDAGEHCHRDDDEQIDPEEKYTRPEISSIVVRDRILGTTGLFEKQLPHPAPATIHVK